MSRPSTVNHMIDVPAGLTTIQVDALQFLEKTRGLSYDNRFKQIGYLCALAGGAQLAHFYAQRFKNHAVR